MPNSITIKGLDKLTRKLKSFEDMKKVIPALEAGANHIEGVVKEYPDSTEANTPGQARWYERGYGPRWLRKDGSWGGSKTSEVLGKQWAVKSKNKGLTWIIGNPVSYGKYVHGEEQASFHGPRGWKKIEDVAKEESDTILKFVKDRVDKILAG